jgi:hypothetical protein
MLLWEVSFCIRRHLCFIGENGGRRENISSLLPPTFTGLWKTAHGGSRQASHHRLPQAPYVC